MYCARVQLSLTSIFNLQSLPCDWMSQVRYVLENCKEDMEFFDKWVEKDIVTRLTVCFK